MRFEGDGRHGLSLRVFARGRAVAFAAACVAFSPVADAAAPAPAGRPLAIHYLERRVERPVPLNNEDPIPDDEGLRGAELGLKDSNATGRFVGLGFDLDPQVVEPGADIRAAFRALEHPRFVVLNMPAADVLAVADLPEAKGVVLLNVGAPDTRLRDADCRPGLLHVLPSRAMLADALVQFLAFKRWSRILLVAGPAPGDALYAEALRRSARKFGARIVAEAAYDPRGGDVRDAALREFAIPTRGPEHDVVAVADEAGEFGTSLNYNTAAPRPVVGTQGLSPAAWGRPVEAWAAVQLQGRFRRLAGRPMRPVDWAGWMAVHAVGEAAVQARSADPDAVAKRLLSDAFEVGGFKGRPLSFRRWDGQLRQPVFLLWPGAVTATAPIEGFLHHRTELDTLGLDEPESACRAFSGRAGMSPLRAIGLLAVLAAAGPARAEEIFVTNERDNTVSVIDGASLEVVRTFPVGRRPRGLTFSADGRALYVCASDSDAVQVIDPDTGQVRHNLPSGEDPEQFALAPDGRTLFIANEENATTTVVDAQSRKVLAQIDVGIEPEGVAVSPDGRIAVTTSETTNMVHWIDTGKLEAFDATPVGQRPRFAAFTGDGKTLWASSEIGGTVSVIDVATRKVVTEIGFEVKGVSADRIQPVGIQLSRDGRLAFVALGPSDRVAVVDARTFKVLSYLLVGRRVWQLALNADGSRLFTTNGVSGDVTVIDTATLKPLRTVKVGRFPWGAAARPMPGTASPDGRAVGAAQ